MNVDVARMTDAVMDSVVGSGICRNEVEGIIRERSLWWGDDVIAVDVIVTPHPETLHPTLSLLPVNRAALRTHLRHVTP